MQELSRELAAKGDIAAIKEVTATLMTDDRVELGSCLLGKADQKFRRTYFGHVNTPGPPAAYIAGFAVGDLKK